MTTTEPMALVTYTRTDATARIHLNRPDLRNALNAELVQELKEALAEAAADPVVRVVVLGGEGKVFSAGADLKALQALQTATPMENERDSRHLADLFEAIYLHPKPVIARVHGHAIAGGCGLAAVCDFSIVSDRAKLGFTEVRIGFVPAIVMVFLLRKVGEAAARDLLLRGHLVTAQKAQDMGLVSEVVPDEKVDDRVQELASELATQTSGSAVSLTKRMIASVQSLGLREGIDQAVQMNAFARGTADCQAGIAAFLSKTDPPWRS